MFEICSDGFYLNGRPFVIHSAALHFFRFLPVQWEDRLKKLKACGFNTVETYVCWNQIEKVRGCFDDTQLDLLETFLSLAQELGLWAIVRPSPYICAEIDGGGLPAWLRTEPGDALPLRLRKITLRSSDPLFLEAVDAYYARLIPRLAAHQLSRGGNILLCQIENEYGSYGNDTQYLTELMAMIRKYGLEVPFFTSDSPWLASLSAGSLRDPKALASVNFGSSPEENLARLKAFQPDKPLFCGEYWLGWFDRWGGPHMKRDAAECAADIQSFLSLGASFNAYLFAGGTNFGLTAGANVGAPSQGGYQPTVTSYDYDALLTEWGACTEKYEAVRRLLAPGSTERFEPPCLQSPGRVALTSAADVQSYLRDQARCFRSSAPLCFEELGLSGGLMLYRTRLTGPREAQKLYLDGLHDAARLYLNGSFLGSLTRNEAEAAALHPDESGIPLPALKAGEEALLEIVVESLGHVNYGAGLLDLKGLTGPVRCFGQQLFGWDCLPLAPEALASLPCELNSDELLSADTRPPYVLSGRFPSEPGKDCFLHPDGLSDGYLFVNGFFLGRYRAEGPQHSLYLPGPLLKEDNVLTAIELTGIKALSVTISDEHDLG